MIETLIISAVAFAVLDNKEEIIILVSFLVLIFLHITTPNRFTFNETSIVIHYGFFIKREIKWINIKEIHTSISTNLLRPPYSHMKSYYIVEFGDKIKWFFMDDSIPKTKKTMKEIEKYSKGKISEI